MDVDQVEAVNVTIDFAALCLFDTFFRALGFGISTPIFINALRRLYYNHDHVSASEGTMRFRSGLFHLISLQFLLYALYVFFLLAGYMTSIKAYHFSGDAFPLYVPPPTFVRAQTILTAILIYICTLITEGLMVWRAWCLYPHNVFVKLLLTFWMFCVTALTIADIGVYAYLYTADSPTVTIYIQNVLYGTMKFLDFAVNFVATSLIVRVAWKHRQQLRPISPPGRRRSTPVSFVLSKLIETGTILCVLQLVVAVLAVAYSGSDYADAGFIASFAVQGLMEAFTAAHPALLVLVIFGKTPTIHEATISSPVPSPASPDSKTKTHISTLRFASASAHTGQSTVRNESGNDVNDAVVDLKKKESGEERKRESVMTADV